MLSDRSGLEAMGLRARAMAREDALDKIYQAIIETVNN